MDTASANRQLGFRRIASSIAIASPIGTRSESRSLGHNHLSDFVTAVMAARSF